MIEPVASGVYAYMPLALRSLRKIEAIVRDEMDRADGQEVVLPVLQPLEIWQKSGHDKAFGENLLERIAKSAGEDLRGEGISRKVFSSLLCFTSTPLDTSSTLSRSP